jgi:hypothetical protein
MTSVEATPVVPLADVVVQFARADAFAEVDEPSAEAIIGDEGRIVLTADGTVIAYAEAGAGKTTLTVDMASHVGSGSDWLGLTVPRPLRVAIVENEGSRGPFRKKIAAKIQTWGGPDWAQNVWLLEEPWASLDLTNALHRQQLADLINRHKIDVLVLGPLVELGGGGGAANGGTPSDVTAWTRSTFAPLRELIGRPIALWIVHHTNKAGDISGAWRRYPDTLIQIVGESEGRSAIKWEKVRHGSLLHGTTTRVEWDRETVGYTIVEQAPGGPRKASAGDIAVWIRSQGGRATPAQLKQQFAFSDGTLRDRRSELGELGIDYRGTGKDIEYIDQHIHPSITSPDPAPAPRSELRGNDSAGSNGLTMRDSDPAPRNPAIQPTAGSGNGPEQGKSTTPHPALPIGSDPPPAGSGVAPPTEAEDHLMASIENLPPSTPSRAQATAPTHTRVPQHPAEVES